MNKFFKLLALIGAAVLALAVDDARADVGIQRTPLGYQQITSVSAAAGLTVPSGAKEAVITVEAQAVRYRDDGTNPTATVGMPLAVGQVLDYTGTLSAIKIIEQTGGAKVNILYYK